MVVGGVVAAAEDEVLDGDDADEGGGPVADEGDEVLEVDEEVALGADGGGDDDDGHDDGEGVPRDLDQAGDEGLEVEGDGVHGASGVAEEGQGEDHDDELAEAAGGLEHRGEDTADEGLAICFRPFGDIRGGSGDGGAKNHEENGGEDEAQVAVKEHAPSALVSG